MNQEIQIEQEETIDSQDKGMNESEKRMCCMFHHNSKFRMRWDLYIIGLALYNCVTIPYEVAFNTKFTDHWSLAVINYIVDICFFLDVVMNFRTTYINNKTGSEVTS